ncbi:MAG: hypothetical protein RIC52_13065 [Amphiplicatus sp.]
MKKLMAAAAIAALSIGAASAQEEYVSNPRGVIPNFDVASVGPILTELGAVWHQRQGAGGQPYIALSAGGDLSMMMIPTACKGENFTNCVGMNTVAAFSGHSFNHQTVSAFNQRYWFSTAGMSEDGSGAYISRYEIADYGIARGNVASSVLNLYELAKIFQQELTTAANTVSLEGYAEDLAARHLNATGLTALAGPGATTAATRHQAAMEESASLIRTLMSDKAAPSNKIENIGAKR